MEFWWALPQWKEFPPSNTWECDCMMILSLTFIGLYQIWLRQLEEPKVCFINLIKNTTFRIFYFSFIYPLDNLHLLTWWASCTVHLNRKYINLYMMLLMALWYFWMTFLMKLLCIMTVIRDSKYLDCPFSRVMVDRQYFI